MSPAKASTPIIERDPIKVVADILQVEMELKKGRVVLSDEDWKMPTDAGLLVLLSYAGSGKTISASSLPKPVKGGGLNEIQRASMSLPIQIELISADNSARFRQAEVGMALASTYSEQQQERYNIQIARNPGPFVNLSGLEETRRLKRFATTVPVFALFTKTKAVPYFDKFTNPPEVLTNG